MNLNPKTTSFLRYLALNTLWEGVSSNTLQYSLLIASNVQALAFTVNRLFTIVPISNIGTMTYVIKRLGALFLIRSYFITVSNSALLLTHIFAWLYNALIAGFLVLAAINKFRNRNLSTRLRFLMMILFQFHLCFGFVYIVMILLNTIINPVPRETLAQVAHSYEWLILTVNIASVILSTLIGFFAAVFSYDPFLSKNLLSCRSPSCQFIIFVYKVFMCYTTYLVIDPLATSWMTIGITVTLFTARHFYLFKRFPFYNYATMRMSITLSTLCLVLSWVNLLFMIIASIFKTHLTSESILYVGVVLLILSLIFWNIYFHNKAKKHLMLPNKQLRSEDQVFIKFFALRFMLENSKMTAGLDKSILYWGAYQDFIKQHQTEHGLDWNKSHNYSTEDMRKLTLEEFQSLSAKFKRDFEADFMKESVEMVKNSRMTTVLLVNFLMDSIDSLSTSVFYLTRLTKSRVFEPVIISKFYEKVQQNVSKVLLENKGSQLLDIQKYVDSEFVSRKFLNLLNVNAKSYVDYWTYYEEQNMAVVSLFGKHKRIEQQSKEIHYYWTKYVEMNKHIFKSLIPVYSYYQSLVKNRPVTAAKLLKKYQVIYDQNLDHIKDTSLQQSDLNDPNILILQASMSREKLGVIRSVSSQISEILGWSSKDIIGRNVSLILPEFMREPHHQLLQKHLQKIQDISYCTRLNKVIESFVLNRDGYVVPCEIYLSIHPYILEELAYIAVMKVKEMKEGVILLSEEGYVEGLSHHMERDVGRIQGRKLHMQEICKNYKDMENIVKITNSSAVSLGKNGRKLTGVSLNHSPIIKPTTFYDLENTNISLTLGNFDDSRKKRDYHHYSTVIRQNQAFETRFYVLKLTLDVKSLVLDCSSSDGVIAENDVESSIPSEKNSEEGVIPSSFRRLRSNNLLTYKSDSHRGLLEPTNLLSFQTNVSARPENNKTLIQNVQTKDIENNTTSSPIRTKKIESKKQDQKKRGWQNILSGSQKTSVTSGDNYDAQMEAAVNSNPKTEHLSVMKWIGMSLIFVIPFTLLWIQVEKNTVTSLVNGNIDFISQATQLLANIVVLNQATRYIILDEMGLFSVNKYGREAKYILQGPIIDLSLETNTLSNNIRNSLDKIDANLRNTAYDLKVPVIDVNVDGTSTIVSEVNVFDFIVEIASRGIKLGNIPISHLNATLPEVSFIVDNTMNEFLVIWEQMGPLLVEDSKLKLRSQETLIGVLWGVISVIGLVILKMIFDGLRNFRKKRDHLLNILLRLDDKQITKNTQRVQKFVRILEKGFVSPSINEKIEQELFENFEAKYQSSHNMRKSFKIQGINSALYHRYTLVLVLFLALVSIYLILFVLARSQTSLITTRINLMVQSYDYYYQTTLAVGILYDYVQNNITTTVRNRPIQEELYSLFSDLSKVQDFYVGTMLSKNTGLTSNQTLYDLVQGNICSLYDFSPFAKEICTTTDGGILKKGVVGLNSYLLSTIESLIASFDNSPRAFSDMYAFINSPDLSLEELVQYFYLEPVYTSLDTLIRNSLHDNQNSYLEAFQWIIIVFSILCFSIVWICWVYITKSFEVEMILWMKMIRQVPWDVLVNNKLLKTYLIKNNGIASSINN